MLFGVQGETGLAQHPCPQPVTGTESTAERAVIDLPHTAGRRTPFEDGRRAAVSAGYLHGQPGPPEKIRRQIPAILRQDAPFPDLARRTGHGQAGQPFRTGRDGRPPAHQFPDRSTGVAPAIITAVFPGQAGADHETATGRGHLPFHLPAFRNGQFTPLGHPGFDGTLHGLFGGLHHGDIGVIQGTTVQTMLFLNAVILLPGRAQGHKTRGDERKKDPQAHAPEDKLAHLEHSVIHEDHPTPEHPGKKGGRSLNDPPDFRWSLDLGRDFGEDLVEHDPGHEQGQDQVQGLAADIEQDGLAALEILAQFAEVRGQADGHEGQGEEPAAQGNGDLVDAVVHQHLAHVSPQRGADHGHDDGSRQEAQHELGEAVPDLHGADLLTFLHVHLGAPVHGHAEGRHTDEHVLDHLDRSGHLQGLGTDEGTGSGHGAGGVHSAADPGAAQDLRHAHPVDEGGHGHHHDGGEGQGQADGQGQFFLLGTAGSGGGDGRRGAAHGHVGGNDHVQGTGRHLEHLLAENEGADEHDGGHHPGHENAGDADGQDLVEQHFGTQQHQTGLDEVFHLGAVRKGYSAPVLSLQVSIASGEEPVTQ